MAWKLTTKVQLSELLAHVPKKVHAEIEGFLQLSERKVDTPEQAEHRLLESLAMSYRLKTNFT